MNKHQSRLLNHMILSIQDYIDGKTDDFYVIVGILERALDASEIRDRRFIDQWYNCWTPLEARRASEGGKVNRHEAVKELEAMKTFLLNVLV